MTDTSLCIYIRVKHFGMASIKLLYRSNLTLSDLYRMMQWKNLVECGLKTRLEHLDKLNIMFFLNDRLSMRIVDE